MARAPPCGTRAGDLARCARPAVDGLPRRFVCDRGVRAGRARAGICLCRGRAGAPRARPPRTRRVSALALRVAAHARGLAGPRRPVRAWHARAARVRESGNRRRLPKHAGVCRAAAASRRGDHPAPRLRSARVPCGRGHRRRAGERHRDCVRARRHLLRAGSGERAPCQSIARGAGVSRHGRRIAVAAQARRVRAASDAGAA